MGLIGEETGGKYISYHFDLRGSTVALTNSTGQVTERFQYSPYGMLLSGDAEKTPFLFNGMYGVMTDSNGLYYMRARFYSPEMRRFVNQDILLGNIDDGQTLNRYAYVTGNPVSYVDPFGLDGMPIGMFFLDWRALFYPTPTITSIPQSDARSYIGLSSDKTWFFFIGGLSHQTAVIVEPSTGKKCVNSTYCSILGPGLYLGASVGVPFGIAMQDIEKSLAGFSISLAGEVAIVKSVGLEASCGIDEEGMTSLGSSKSPFKYGAGGGAWIGISFCITKVLMCF